MSKQIPKNVTSECKNGIMNNSNSTKVVATEDNYLELMSKMGSLTILKLASTIVSRLSDLQYFYPDSDDGRWLEKPQYFPEFWVAAINGTLYDTEFNFEEEE
jgi:hypothetical protein